MKIGVFYGSTNGNTAEAAKMIQHQLSAQSYDVGKLNSPTELNQYDVLILGTSTWYDGELQDDWESFMKHLGNAELNGKKVALFGMGDQEGYGSDYVSGMKIIYDVVVEKGAIVIGSWSTEGYSYEHSASVIDGKFVGLALDEDNQSELTAERIDLWCKLLKSEMQVCA